MADEKVLRHQIVGQFLIGAQAELEVTQLMTAACRQVDGHVYHLYSN